MQGIFRALAPSGIGLRLRTLNSTSFNETNYSLSTSKDWVLRRYVGTASKPGCESVTVLGNRAYLLLWVDTSLLGHAEAVLRSDVRRTTQSGDRS